jgi:hypothetical protein
MSTRARIIAAQAAAVAALVLVVYVTLLRDDPNAPIPDIQAPPGGEQVQNGAGPDGGDGAKGNGRGNGEGEDAEAADGHGNGAPGLHGPAGTGTVIVGGPAWMGSFNARPAPTDTDTPPTDQYADAVGRLLGKVGADTIAPDGTTSSTGP